MTSLRKPAAGIVAAVVLVPLALVGSAGPVSAQSTTCDLRPRGTIVGAKTKTVDFDVPSATAWTYELPELGLYVYDTEVDGDGSFAEIGPRQYRNSDAGAHQGEVQRTRRSDGVQDTCTATWRIKRATRLQNVKVQKIKYGRKITGKLERVVWGRNPDHRWTTYSKGYVTIRFLNARGQWQTAGGAELTKGGKFTFTKQIGERRWRLYFQGDGLSGSSPEIEVKG